MAKDVLVIYKIHISQITKMAKDVLVIYKTHISQITKLVPADAGN